MEMTLTLPRESAHPRRRRHLNLVNTLIILAMSLVSLLMAFPFIWMFSASLKIDASVFRLPPELWPYEWRFDNYLEVLAHPNVPVLMFFLNSLKLSVIITAGQLLFCTLAAYSFSRLRFAGRDVLFGLLLTSLMVPIQLTTLPTYILMRNLGLVNTHAALILPDLVGIFGIFLLRQFFMTIPDDLEDAARIDGAGPVRILWQVLVPLVGPGLSTLGIITFNRTWNMFFTPLIFLRDRRLMTWPLGLAILRGEFSEGSLCVQMAGISLAVIPVAILFALGQRFIIESITFTGIKA